MRPKRKKEESGSYTCILGLFLLLFTSVAFAAQEGVLVETKVTGGRIVPTVGVDVTGWHHNFTNDNRVMNKDSEETFHSRTDHSPVPTIKLGFSYQPKTVVKKYISAVPTRRGYVKIDSDGRIILPDNFISKTERV